MSAGAPEEEKRNSEYWYRCVVQSIRDKSACMIWALSLICGPMSIGIFRNTTFSFRSCWGGISNSWQKFSWHHWALGDFSLFLFSFSFFGMCTHGCMPSLKFTTALKPLHLIKSIQAAYQTGRVNAAAYNSEAVLQDIDRCVSIGTVCLRSSTELIYLLQGECCSSGALCLFALVKHGNYFFLRNISSSTTAATITTTTTTAASTTTF